MIDPNEPQPLPEEIEQLIGRINKDYDQRLWLAFWAAGLTTLREAFNFTEQDSIQWAELTKARVERYLGIGEAEGNGRPRKRRKGF